MSKVWCEIDLSMVDDEELLAELGGRLRGKSIQPAVVKTLLDALREAFGEHATWVVQKDLLTETDRKYLAWKAQRDAERAA